MRDLFEHGLLELLTSNNGRVTLFSEAGNVGEFVEKWRRPNVSFRYLWPYLPRKRANLAFAMRRSLAGRGYRRPLQWWTKYEQRHWHPPRPEYLDFLREDQPDIVVATNVHLPWENSLLNSAHELGIPTLGMVKSWDNVQKGLRGRPQHLAVWNEVNRQEVVDLEGYLPSDVTVIGPPAFDTYFERNTIWPREKLARHFQLDSNRPIILFATLGYFVPPLDETCWMDCLLDYLNSLPAATRPQVICRLHPWSRLEHFRRFADHPDVRLSFVDRYYPSLTWYMTKDDMVLMANMLAHADVVISPGSTVILEAAIFDRPTLAPIFHTHQPDRAKDYFHTWVLSKHYGRIARENLVCLIELETDFAPALERCLADPAWYREQRMKLVEEYVVFRDGASTQRFAELIRAKARQGTRA